ncbi:probable WRKY transcription factor 54 [Prosopis cineraria]|uniref:probable WRKY transcription factor 54 n=1 Tax=Prosopis cineraria TaxID=364024 RepID=UPI0024105F53|nr:probable WRKY transcription factor 54 [Prosopis cineraria]
MENIRVRASCSDDVRKAITEELLKGRDLSEQLLELVLHHDDDESNNIGSSSDSSSLVWIHPFAQDLVSSVLTSFSNTLHLLNSLDPKSGEDLKCCKTSNGRGCYLSKNYYRCSHKDDQGCPAMKQVQRVREWPPLHRTTYFRIHTCKTHRQLLSEKIHLEYPSPGNLSESSLLLSFNNNFLPAEKELQQVCIDVKQNPASQQGHVTTVSSSTSDQFSLVKVQPIHVDDDVFKCSEFDESVQIGPGFGFIKETKATHQGCFVLHDYCNSHCKLTFTTFGLDENKRDLAHCVTY